jgi:hypothetical protein
MAIYTTSITQPATDGGTVEVINLKFEYCADFTGDGFADVRVTATVAPESRSSGGTIEDLRGLAFDLDSSVYSLSDLQISDITILEAQAPNSENTSPFSPASIIDKDGIGDGVDPEPGFNINGGDLKGLNFDASVELSGNGASDGTVQSASFVISSAGVDINAEALLDGTDWFARLQSTDGGGGSSKMLLTDLDLPACIEEPPPNEDYQGLTPGYWKTHGPDAPGGQENDWDNDYVTNAIEVTDRPVYGDSALTFDQLIFGGGLQSDGVTWDIDPSKAVLFRGDLSVAEALSAQGGGKYELARHSMAAMLNSRDEDVNYFATESDICSWTAAVLAGGTAVIGNNAYDLAGLATLFKSNNELGLEPSLAIA